MFENGSFLRRRKRFKLHQQRQLSLGLLSAHDSNNLKHSLDKASYLQDDARLRLQQFTENAASSVYVPVICNQTHGRNPYKPPFTIENIMSPEFKNSSLATRPLPNFISQFGPIKNIPTSSFILPYRALRPSESDILSSITYAYGQMNTFIFPIDYYNSPRASMNKSLPALPMPVKPTAVTTACKVANHDLTDTITSKPALIHSVDSLLKPSKETLLASRLTR